MCVGFLISEELLFRRRPGVGAVLDTAEFGNGGVLKANRRIRDGEFDNTAEFNGVQNDALSVTVFL